jgi:AcrR family transcriptional regulator
MIAEDEHKQAIQARKGRERERRQKEILTAANRVFIEKGFFKTTIYDIALEAGLSKPTIYQYFNTKDDLYMSLMLPVIKNINNRLREIYDKIDKKEYRTGAELISDMFESFSYVFYEDPELFVMFMVSQETGVIRVLDESTRQKIVEKGRKGYELGRMILSGAMEQKLLRDVNVYSLADMIWGMFWGVLQLGLIKAKNSNISRTLQPTIELAKGVIIDSMVIKNQ